MDGYDFTRDDFAALLVRKFYPEKTDRETPVIKAYLEHHLFEFDRVSFSVRVGEGQTPDPDMLPGVQRSVARSTKKRMDFLGWNANTPTIGEIKERVDAACLGQLLAYRQLLLEELPTSDDPRLIAIGRYSDPDTLRTLRTHGIDVYLYPDAIAG